MSQRQTDRKGKKTFRIEQALKEKETGNTFFKKGNYKKAIEHYGKALELDPKEAVYVINRAMAHLKLKNWVEAESDCTLGLLLHPGNVKALWRRGIARREMGSLEEAKKDLEDALKLEPNDQSINDEYSKVMDAINTVQVKPKEIFQNATITNTVETKAIVNKISRRRLTVEEVEFDEDERIIESTKRMQLTSDKNEEVKSPIM
ncbi:11947_t:CDS:2 [Acaulospora colombiana]|uniref:11947_t:CDS:1 n=1 Tax=Acaulospora colombiana TaxID=27376 RepID=A0ACA9LY65_9GLOM|nr:11947_t:CDS:2 [Acaulospora colombiana]